MLPSLGGGERDQEVYSLTSATRKGRERKHRPSQDLREDDTFPPFSQVKWDTEWSHRDGYCTVTTVVYQDYSVASVMLSEANKTQRIVPCPFF